MRQSFETEREQILQRPIVVDLSPTSAAPRLRCGIQHRSDVTTALNEKDFCGRLELITGAGKIRAQCRNRNPHPVARARTNSFRSASKCRPGKVSLMSRRNEPRDHRRRIIAKVTRAIISLVSERFDLMRSRVAVSESVGVIRANDFDALSIRSGTANASKARNNFIHLIFARIHFPESVTLMR